MRQRLYEGTALPLLPEVLSAFEVSTSPDSLRRTGMPEKAPNRIPSALFAVGALACRWLSRREGIGHRGALFEVLVRLRFLLFLVATHLTLGHDDLPALVDELGAA